MAAAGADETGQLAPRTAFRRTQDADLEQVAASVQGWDVRLTQLAPGPGRGSIFESALPGAHLACLAVDTKAALESMPRAPRPRESLRIATISPESEALLWHGVSVQSEMLMLEEGDVPSRIALPPRSELLVARLDRTRIESLVRVLGGSEGAPTTRRTQLHLQSASVLAELRSLLGTLVRGGLASRDESIGPAIDELYERAASMLASPQPPVRPSPETRRHALRRAEEYMDAHATERITLSDLCRAAECCERTLRQAFRECYGMGPMSFLKKLRLQGLRSDLRDANPLDTTILELALRWGFWHMGHLGRDYKNLFGETPRETLAGTPRHGRATRGRVERTWARHLRSEGRGHTRDTQVPR